MTQDTLIQTLQDLEWEDFEVKKAEASVPKSAWETVSAFSNTSGGWLLFGIEQTGKKFAITGVKNSEKIEQNFLVTLRSGEKFNTIITPDCKRHKIAGKTILAFYISPSAHKPVYFGNTQYNTFIRKGSADFRATQAEIDYMYRDQTFGVKSSELLEYTSIGSLKSNSIHEYRDYMGRFNPTVGYNQKEMNDFLTGMRVLDKETGTCTVAGLLFFGKREAIEHRFPDFRIDLLEIPGTSYQDAPSRYTFRLTIDDYENLWEAYFECFKRLRKTIDVQFTLTSEGFGEELSPGLNAVREALVNMLMHADYYSTSAPRIRIFTDHLEFYNPGGLPKPLKELKEKDLSIPRNPILAKLFRMVKLAETAGYGFDKMENNWKMYNSTVPTYNIDFDSVIVQMQLEAPNTHEVVSIDKFTEWKNNFPTLNELLNTPPEVNMNYLRDIYGIFTDYLRVIYGISHQIEKMLQAERTINILILIDYFTHITMEEMATVLGVSLSTIEKEIQQLRKGQVVERVGSKKTGFWKIARNPPLSNEN